MLPSKCPEMKLLLLGLKNDYTRIILSGFTYWFESATIEEFALYSVEHLFDEHSPTLTLPSTSPIIVRFSVGQIKAIIEVDCVNLLQITFFSPL